MRIAVVHSFYKSAYPSGENFTVEMQVQALIEDGHQVELISAHTDKLAASRTYAVKSGFNVATGRGLSPLDSLRRFEPDVVHIHNLFPNFSTTWLDDWPGPVVATLHNFRPLCANGILFRDGHNCTLCPDSGQHHAVLHACYKDSRMATAPIAFRNRHGLLRDPVISRADRLIVLSERSRSIYESFGLESNQVAVVPNFIDDVYFDARPADSNGSWFCAGRLTPEKGVLRLLEEWPPNESLIVAGTGPEATKIKSIAAAKDNITFVGGLPRPELLKTLPSTKGLVMPSQCSENMPTIYLEALAAGRPVIAREGNSAADDIKSWHEDLVYTSAEDLQDALCAANNSPDILAEMARAHFLKRFTKDAWTRNIMKLYECVIGSDPQRN